MKGLKCLKPKGLKILKYLKVDLKKIILFNSFIFISKVFLHLTASIILKVPKVTLLMF